MHTILVLLLITLARAQTTASQNDCFVPETGEVTTPCGIEQDEHSAQTQFSVCELTANIDTGDVRFDNMIRDDSRFNPDGNPVHYAKLRLSFAGSPCTLDGGDNGRWTVIGTEDTPQSRRLNECDEGTVTSGECMPFGPVRIDSTVGFLRWVEEFEPWTDGIENFPFDYIAYYRDKDTFNMTTQVEGARGVGATCVNVVSNPNNSEYWQCAGGPPNLPAAATANDNTFLDGCTPLFDHAMSPDMLRNCSNAPSDEPSYLGYTLQQYTSDAGGTRRACTFTNLLVNGETRLLCMEEGESDTSELSNYPRREIDPQQTPQAFYQYFTDPEGAFAARELAIYAPGYEIADGEQACDPNRQQCRFNYFNGVSSPQLENFVSDPTVNQWIDFNSNMCRVPSPQSRPESQSYHLMNPSLYEEIASGGNLNTNPNTASNFGVWQDPVSASHPYWAPTCLTCNPADPNCDTTKSFQDYDRSITAQRRFQWNVGPNCRVFRPTSGRLHPIPLWNLTLSINTPHLSGQTFTLQVGSQTSGNLLGNNEVPVFEVISDNEQIAASIRAVNIVQPDQYARLKIGAIVVCDPDESKNPDTNLWAQPLEDFPYVDNNADDCIGCTPLQQSGKESRALWYTIPYDMFDAGFNNPTPCDGSSDSEGSYTSFMYNNPHQGNTNEKTPRNICQQDNLNMCRPTNDGNIVSPCYVAAAFDQFYQDFTAWRDSGATDADRPVWRDYEASRFMPPTFSPYPSPNMWFSRRNHQGHGVTPEAPSLVYTPLLPNLEDIDNPYRTLPYDLQLEIYITDNAARPGKPVVPAEITFDVPPDTVDECPFGDQGSRCSSRCPQQTHMLAAVEGQIGTAMCNFEVPDRTNCAYASFYVNKIGEPDAVYTLDFSDCWNIGLDAFVDPRFINEFGGIEPITNNRTTLDIPEGAQLWRSAQQPLEVFFRLRDENREISDAATCDIQLIVVANNTDILLGSLAIPSLQSSNLLEESDACPNSDATPEAPSAPTGAPPADAPPADDAPVVTPSATPSASRAPNATITVPPEEEPGESGCGFFDIPCQTQDGSDVWDTPAFWTIVVAVIVVLLCIICIPVCISMNRK